MDPKQALFNYLRLVENLRSAARNILSTQPERMSEAANALRTANEELWHYGLKHLTLIFATVDGAELNPAPPAEPNLAPPAEQE